MAKFSKGETSKEVIKRKLDITAMILLKAEIISKINSYEDIPDSLEFKSGKISQNAVHKWSDDNLKVTSYARNSAHKSHNENELNLLLEAIKQANSRLSITKDDTKTNSLRQENEILKNALAEVYRAYISLLHEVNTYGEIDSALKKTIEAQANILGRRRLKEV